MTTKKMTISMPEQLYDRMMRFPETNWSGVARKAIEPQLRILEAIADNDRVAALREKATADCSDMTAAGHEDAINYPIEEIDYGFLREFEHRSRDHIECADTENLIDTFDYCNRSFHKDGTGVAFRLRFSGWEYKLGFITGLLQLKRIADGANVPPKRQSATIASILNNKAKTTSQS